MDVKAPSSSDGSPMLVLSPKAFNDRTSIVIGLPMTTVSYNDSNPFAIRFAGPNGAASYVLGHDLHGSA